MKRLFMAYLLFLAVVSSLQAEPLELKLENCIELALENNPDFKISGISLETAKRNNSNSWNNFLPQLSAGAGVSGDTVLFSGQPDWSWGINGSLSLNLSLNPGIAYTIKSIKLAYEKEQISFETARRQLISNVEKEFYYLITSESNLEIVKANMELAQKNYQQALSNYNFGMASELSVLQAEVNAANLEPAYKQTVATHDSRIKEFLLVIGIDPETEIELNGTLETDLMDFDSEKLISLYLSNRRDIIALGKELEILNNSRSLSAAKSRAPSLSLSSGWTVNNSQPWQDRLSAGLSLSIPIDDFIPGSSTSNSLAAIDDQITQAEINLGKTISQARTEIINLIKQLDTSASNMKLSAMNISLAEKSYEMTEESFAHGTTKRLDVEDAQQAFLSAKYQYLSSQYEYLTGLIELRDALGMNTMEELFKGVNHE